MRTADYPRTALLHKLRNRVQGGSKHPCFFVAWAVPMLVAAGAPLKEDADGQTLLVKTVPLDEGIFGGFTELPARDTPSWVKMVATQRALLEAGASWSQISSAGAFADEDDSLLSGWDWLSQRHPQFLEHARAMEAEVQLKNQVPGARSEKFDDLPSRHRSTKGARL